MKAKPLAWLANKLAAPPLSVEARREAGYLLYQLQRGDKLSLPHSRPMPTVGPRCAELRIPDGDRDWRIIYRIDQDAIVIVDWFPKKTQTTPGKVIERCKARLKAYDKE